MAEGTLAFLALLGIALVAIILIGGVAFVYGLLRAGYDAQRENNDQER